MALTYSEPVKLGMAAPDFDLLGTDGTRHRLTDFRNARALVVVFMCNHCPYVKAVRDRINTLAREYIDRQVQVIAINPNDSTKYPADSFEAMQKESGEHQFAFPYLWDETQEVARAYGAVCTPDFYLFENVGAQERRQAKERKRADDPDWNYAQDFLLRYRGRLDDNWKEPNSVQNRDLAMAIEDVLNDAPVLMEQKPSMGCSIKWRESAA